MRVYFDNAATTQLDPEVLEAMMPYLTDHYGNPSAIHRFGRETRTAIEKARKIIAKYLNASTGEIFFTSGGTESSNTAIHGAVRNLGVRHIISSGIEHHCVLHTLEALGKQEEVAIHHVDVKEDGHIDHEHLDRMLGELEGEKMVSLMHANNEIGTLLDLEKVSAICESHNSYFHSDTVQTIGHFPIDVQEVKVHFLTGSGHKFHGPKGAGFLYINGDIKIDPILLGGAQERNMRAGTENLYGIVGLGKALELAYENLNSHRQHIESIRKYMMGQLEANIPGLTFNGDFKGRYLYTVLNVSFPASFNGDMLLFNLDISGIAASSGSACSSGSSVGSHVIKAIGGDPDRIAIRFSFSKYNTKKEVDIVVETLKRMMPNEETKQ